MQDFARFAPLFVPLAAGILLARLVIELLVSQMRSGDQKANGIKGAWGRFISGLFLAAFLLPFLGPLFRVSFNTTPLWMLLLLCLVASALHGSFLSRQRPTSAPAPTKRPRKARPKPPAPRTAQPPATTEPLPAALPDPQAAALPTLRAAEYQRAIQAERNIGRMPLPLRKEGRSQPVPSDRAESWYERQDNRLQRTLEGKELAAARLRLSTVKSMLLLGQLGLGEADDDVNRVLQRPDG